MSDTPHKLKTTTQVLRAVLVGAGLMILAGFCGIAFYLYKTTPGSDAAISSIGFVLLGLFFAVLLLGVSSLIGLLATNLARQNAAPADDVRPALERLEQSLRLLNNMQSRADHAVATTTADGSSNAMSIRVSHALEQLRDLSLMDEQQKQRFAARHWAHRKLIHLEAIERDVLVGNWPTAFARLEELEIVTPGDAQAAEMRERVESEQVSRLDEDVRVARGRLQQLMAAGMWQQAEDLAAALQAKYPDKPQSDRLADDVRREREAWERDNMDRLFGDITIATEQRRWRQALLAVEEFTRRYPLDPRAEALRLDMPTLRENAAAQERKEQEEHFKELLKRQRYEEALYVGRALIARYPQSAMGTELSRMLPKVEELARQEAAKLSEAGVALQG